MLYRYILQYASPTLAGKKAGSLFRIPHQLWNREKEPLLNLLHTVHLQCIPVEFSGQSVLVYLYSPVLLNSILTNQENISFLTQLNYAPCSETYLETLLKKIRSRQDFPHEIGLFLGYPLQDVEGYIENKGQNCLYNQYWKVYFNVEHAKQTFASYDICKNRLMNALRAGASFEEILYL